MSFDDAMDHFASPMRRRFTVPREITQNDFLDDLADALASFTVAQLTSAANWFRDNREHRVFPTIAECRAAVARQPTEAVYRRVQQIEDVNAQRKSDEILAHRRRIEAYKLCRSGLGHQADQEGWLVALIEFCEDYQRLPERSEIGKVIAKAERSENALRNLNPGDPPPPEASSAIKDDYKGKLAVYRHTSELRSVMLGRAHTEVFEYVPKMMQAAE